MGTPAILRIFYKYYGGIEYFYDKDWELCIDCLEHAIYKENEIPRLIEIVFNKIFKNEEIKSFNNKMRSAEEIMKDYELGGV